MILMNFACHVHHEAVKITKIVKSRIFVFFVAFVVTFDT
jgi:hypothetical protein